MHPSYSRIILHSAARNLLHCSTSTWIYWILIHSCRLSIWISLLYSNRIPWTTCNYRNNFPNHMPTRTQLYTSHHIMTLDSDQQHATDILLT